MAGTVPAHWQKYKMPRGCSIGSFVTDLKNRLAQLEAIARDPISRRGIWLGGLFQPEAYITATRQAIAHQKGWSLEQLVLSLEVEDSSGIESFVIEGGLSVRMCERMSADSRSETRWSSLDGRQTGSKRRSAGLAQGVSDQLDEERRGEEGARGGQLAGVSEWGQE